MEDCREVDFEKYCNTCKYADIEGFDDPCNDCLDHPYNYESEKPVHWREKDT